MKRSEHKFSGILRDKELFLIEDALSLYGENFPSCKNSCKKLIGKLYSDFWEARNCNRPVKIYSKRTQEKFINKLLKDREGRE